MHQLPELGIPGTADAGDRPGEFQFWVEREHLTNTLDVPGLDRIIKMPVMTEVASPEEVINRTIRGEQLPVNPGENHQMVIDGLISVLNGPDAIGLSQIGRAHV